MPAPVADAGAHDDRRHVPAVEHTDLARVFSEHEIDECGELNEGNRQQYPPDRRELHEQALHEPSEPMKPAREESTFFNAYDAE